jgi:hypothetical protein
MNTVIRQFNRRTGRYARFSATATSVSRHRSLASKITKMMINTPRTLAVFALLAMDLAALTPAHAALGGAPTYAVAAHAASAGANSTARLAQASSSTAASYTVNETTLSSGTVVSEYGRPTTRCSG